jgi:hypothetical protein
LVVLLGVNVAVMTDDPALPKSNAPLVIVTTEVAAEEYVHVPVAAVVATLGETMDAFAAP